jgi:hypothetical protein
VPNPYENRSHPEGAANLRPRRKIGLETPLAGRFWGEDKRLIFAPPLWYQSLVLACLAGGGLIALGAWFSWEWVPLMEIGLWLGPALFLSGTWAALSMEYLVIDLKSRTYLRREGRGFGKRTRRGSTLDIDAVVVSCERYVPGLGQVVIYRTVIHWKHAAVPLLVAERERAALQPGHGLNAAAGPILGRAQRYAKAIGVAFYDNSYFHSPAPQAPL